MSATYIKPEAFQSLNGLANLTAYQFGDKMVHHFFCRTCGIYPFHEAVHQPGHYRVNLSCIQGLDVPALAIVTIDGKSF